MSQSIIIHPARSNSSTKLRIGPVGTCTKFYANIAQQLWPLVRILLGQNVEMVIQVENQQIEVISLYELF